MVVKAATVRLHLMAVRLKTGRLQRPYIDRSLQQLTTRRTTTCEHGLTVIYAVNICTYLSAKRPSDCRRDVQNVYSMHSNKKLYFHEIRDTIAAIRFLTNSRCYSNTTVYYGIHERSECIPVDSGVINLIHDRRSCVDFTLEVEANVARFVLSSVNKPGVKRNSGL